MTLQTNVTTTGYKVKLEVSYGAGGIPDAVDVGIYWNPALLGVESLIDTDFDFHDEAKGAIIWCKVNLETKNIFQIDLKRVNPGATYIHGTAVDCKSGHRDATFVQKT